MKNDTIIVIAVRNFDNIYHLIGPPNPNYYYTLQQLEISVLDKTVYKLLTDIEVLYEMATELSDEDHISYQAMFAANEMINLITENDYM